MLLAMNAALIAVLFAVYLLAGWAGWQINLGFLIGTFAFYAMFRWHYGWWPDFGVDGEDAKNAELPALRGRRQIES